MSHEQDVERELMRIADEQIAWIAEKYQTSPAAARLALLSVLKAVTEPLAAENRRLTNKLESLQAPAHVTRDPL